MLSYGSSDQEGILLIFAGIFFIGFSFLQQIGAFSENVTYLSKNR